MRRWLCALMIVCLVLSRFLTSQPDLTIVHPCTVPSSIACWEYRMSGVYYTRQDSSGPALP